MQQIDRGQILGNNLFINGACQVAQRATKALSTTFDYGSVDRMNWGVGGTVTAGTMQQGTGLSYGATGTSAQASGVSINSGGYLYAEQCIESKIAALIKNKNFSTSVLIEHNVGSTIYAAINIYALSTADDFSGGYSAVHTGTKTAIPTGTATLLTANNITGTDTSKGIIYDVVFYGDAVGAGLPAITTKTFNVTNWQLNQGAKATDFIAGRYDNELFSCQRYYESGRFFHVGYVSGAINMGSEVMFKQAKYKSTIVTQTNVSNTNCSATTQQTDLWSGGFLSLRTGTGAGAAQYSETWTADGDV